MNWTQFVDYFDEQYYNYAATREDWKEAEKRVAEILGKGVVPGDVTFVETENEREINVLLFDAIVAYIFQDHDHDTYWIAPTGILREKDETPVRAGYGEWDTLDKAKAECAQDVIERLETRGCYIDHFDHEWPEDHESKLAAATAAGASKQEIMEIMYPPVCKNPSEREELLKTFGATSLNTLYSMASRLAVTKKYHNE